jgi:hypothetical protein
MFCSAAEQRRLDASGAGAWREVAVHVVKAHLGLACEADLTRIGLYLLLREPLEDLLRFPHIDDPNTVVGLCHPVRDRTGTTAMDIRRSLLSQRTWSRDPLIAHGPDAVGAAEVD